MPEVPKNESLSKSLQSLNQKEKNDFDQVPRAEESGRIVVAHLEDCRSIAAKIKIQGPL